MDAILLTIHLVAATKNKPRKLIQRKTDAVFRQTQSPIALSCNVLTHQGYELLTSCEKRDARYNRILYAAGGIAAPIKIR